jgi:predicted Rdx family selenoprotein
MRVVVFYCELCHLRKPAEAIVAAVREELGAVAETRTAVWGTFRIEANGMVVYDRWTHSGWLGRIGFGRLPTVDEAVELVRARLAVS